MARGGPSHFAQRAQERGIYSIDGDVLKRLIERDIAAENHTLGEWVCEVGPKDCGAWLYRVVLREGTFYAVMRQFNGQWTACTVLTQEQKRGLIDKCKGLVAHIRSHKKPRKQDVK